MEMGCEEDYMTLKRFLFKAAIDLVIFILLVVLIAAIAQAASPVVTNDIYLEQMTNSEDAFVLMNAYTQIRPIFYYIFVGVIILFIGIIANDTYKFIKSNKEK